MFVCVCVCTHLCVCGSICAQEALCEQVGKQLQGLWPVSLFNGHTAKLLWCHQSHDNLCLKRSLRATVQYYSSRLIANMPLCRCFKLHKLTAASALLSFSGLWNRSYGNPTFDWNISAWGRFKKSIHTQYKQVLAHAQKHKHGMNNWTTPWTIT